MANRFHSFFWLQQWLVRQIKFWVTVATTIANMYMFTSGPLTLVNAIHGILLVRWCLFGVRWCLFGIRLLSWINVNVATFSIQLFTYPLSPGKQHHCCTSDNLARCVHKHNLKVFGCSPFISSPFLKRFLFGIDIGHWRSWDLDRGFCWKISFGMGHFTLFETTVKYDPSLCLGNWEYRCRLWRYLFELWVLLSRLCQVSQALLHSSKLHRKHVFIDAKHCLTPSNIRLLFFESP